MTCRDVSASRAGIFADTGGSFIVPGKSQPHLETLCRDGRRALWEATGPLDESLSWVFDWEWFIRAHARSEFVYLPRDLALYRVQPAALSSR